MIRVLLVVLMSLVALAAPAAEFTVSNNPYELVDFDTTEKCLSQLHDHVKDVSRIAPYDDAGYCAITWMDYGGYYSETTGLLIGFGPPRQWPATSYGATDPSALTNLEFYIPGAEEAGYVSDNTATSHMHSTFMTDYIEAAGCPSCGPGGIPLPPTPGVPAENLYDSDLEQLNLIKSFGGFVIENHPSLGSAQDLEWDGVEIVNTFMAMRDEEDGFTPAQSGSRISNALALWDEKLESRSARLWGVAVNDNFGPYLLASTPFTSSSGTVPDPVTAQMLDQGKIEVLVGSKDLTTYEAAFRKGAFFAVWEDTTQATKTSYPDVTDITVTTSLITITTAAGTETFTWIANGAAVGDSTGVLNLRDLPVGSDYVRAEINDGAGRTLYTQPFELTAPLPQPAGYFGRRFGSVGQGEGVVGTPAAPTVAALSYGPDSLTVHVDNSNLEPLFAFWRVEITGTSAQTIDFTDSSLDELRVDGLAVGSTFGTLSSCEWRGEPTYSCSSGSAGPAIAAGRGVGVDPYASNGYFDFGPYHEELDYVWKDADSASGEHPTWPSEPSSLTPFNVTNTNCSGAGSIILGMSSDNAQVIVPAGTYPCNMNITGTNQHLDLDNAAIIQGDLTLNGSRTSITGGQFGTTGNRIALSFGGADDLLLNNVRIWSSGGNDVDAGDDKERWAILNSTFNSDLYVMIFSNTQSASEWIMAGNDLTGNEVGPANNTGDATWRMNTGNDLVMVGNRFANQSVAPNINNIGVRLHGAWPNALIMGNQFEELGDDTTPAPYIWISRGAGEASAGVRNNIHVLENTGYTLATLGNFREFRLGYTTASFPTDNMFDIFVRDNTVYSPNNSQTHGFSIEIGTGQSEPNPVWEGNDPSTTSWNNLWVDIDDSPLNGSIPAFSGGADH